MTDHKRPPAPEAQPPPKQTPRISSQDLLAGGREIVIVHGDVEYRLRLTSQDKLILTK
ncbi:MAG: hemin uptake protein HemP [Sphingomonadales bacterium]